MVKCPMLFQTPNNCINRDFLSRQASDTGRLFLQIGAGAGNRDPRTAFKDGFTDYISSVELTDRDRIILVEPNPGNVAMLQECWADTDCAHIFPVAILPNGEQAREITLWFAREDAPYYQIASHDRSHVEHHYPQGTIESISVAAMPFDELLLEIRHDLSLEVMGIDVEGLDAEILLSIDWTLANFHAISFESVHMGPSEKAVRQRLQEAGYVSAGYGLDVHGLDSLMVKPDSTKLHVRARIWELEREAGLAGVNGNPWKSFLYLVNWFRTKKTRVN